MGVKPILERILEPGFVFSLRWDNGNVFGRVIDVQLNQYAPYPLIDASGDAVDIDPSSHQDTLRFNDPRNEKNDIVYLESSVSPGGCAWFLHGSVGIKPANVRMYPQIPEKKTVPGKFPNIDGIQPSAADNVGYIDAQKSPYDEPTSMFEYVLPPNMHMGVEYYNMDDTWQLRPVLNLMFAVYYVKMFNPDADRSFIRKICMKETTATFLTAGFPDAPLRMGAALMKNWGVEPIPFEEVVE